MGLSCAATRQSIFVVGVVFRGSLWLDGVVTSTIRRSQKSYVPDISKLIRSTKQFSQLHVIILSRRALFGSKLSLTELSRRTKLPVQSLTKTRRSSPSHKFTADPLIIKVNETRRAISFAGVPRDRAEELYKIGCSSDCDVPEAVRVADLISSQLRVVSRGKQTN